MKIDREAARQDIIPGVLEMVTQKVGPLVAFFRTDNAVILRLLKPDHTLVHMKFPDDEKNSESAGQSGMPYLGRVEDLSLLHVVPICRGDGCDFECGCRCLKDLGYSTPEKPFSSHLYPQGGEAFICSSRHEPPSSMSRKRRRISHLNGEKMVTDLAAQLAQ